MSTINITTDAGTKIYSLSKITKQYNQKKKIVTALDEVDLEIQAGEMIAIQGPTGGGKSTLLQMLGLLDRPTSGQLLIEGRNAAEISAGDLGTLRAEKIGFVFQNYNLIPTLNAIDNVETALVPLGIEASERRARALGALESVGLADRANHLPTELSGGQQQRVAIARALVKNPDVILADEPTGNLDEKTRDEIVNLLETLNREKGITLIIVTHDSQVAKRAKTLLRIEGGKLTRKK